MRQYWFLFIVGGVTLSGCTAQMRVGVSKGQFLPCPSTPNCISTQSDMTDTTHYEAPLPYTVGSKSVIPMVANLVKEGPRSEIMTQTDRYIHATYKSAIFRFVDDVEFLVDPKTKHLHIRSLSRVGSGDLGVNRRRVRLFREKLAPQLQALARTPEVTRPVTLTTAPEPSTAPVH